jgi:hypothetical protein
MANSVCEKAPSRQAKSHTTGFQLGALSLVSNTVIHGVPNQGVTWIAVVVLILVLVVVVPAVWSGKRYRRKAGLDVLDRIVRWRW